MAMELDVAIKAVENGAEKPPLLYHCRDQNCAKSCNSCRTGTGDCAEEAGYDNTYDGDTASFVSNAGINELISRLEIPAFAMMFPKVRKTGSPEAGIY